MFKHSPDGDDYLQNVQCVWHQCVHHHTVHFDSQLTMRDHVTATCRSCFFFQLRQLRAIRSSLTIDAAKTLAQAFVGVRPDYCNSLLYGVSEDRLRRLQSVQNASGKIHPWCKKIRSHLSCVA